MLLNPIKKVFLVCFCGFLLSLSAPGYDLWFIAWIGLVPLFIVINKSRKLRETTLYSFLFGFFYNFSYLYWLFSLHPLDWLGFSNTASFFISILALFVVTIYNSLYFIIFAILVFYLKKFSVHPYDKGIPNLLLVTFIWLIVFNKLSACKFLLGFPWTLIEHSQYKNLFLIQIAEYFGGVSVSFLIVFFNLILANFLIWQFSVEKITGRYVSKDPGQIASLVRGFSFIMVLILLSAGSGASLYGANQQKFTKRSQNVSTIQGNLPLKVTRGEKQDINFAKKIYENLISKSTAKLVIFPEGALPTIFNKDLSTQYWLKSISKQKELDIISGTYCREVRNKNLTNCTVLHSLANNKSSYYEKSRLVAFGEFTPFSFLFPNFLKKFASNLIGDGFVEGKENKPIETSLGKVGVNICFELIFPELVRKHVLQGANFLVNVSDLSWFSNDQIKKQFLSFGVFRAIENRKWVIIASNNGISAFIEPSGKIKSQSLSNTQELLTRLINPNNKITFYARYGW